MLEGAQGEYMSNASVYLELNFLAQAEQLGVAHARAEEDSAQFSGMQQ